MDVNKEAPWTVITREEIDEFNKNNERKFKNKCMLIDKFLKDRTIENFFENFLDPLFNPIIYYFSEAELEDIDCDVCVDFARHKRLLRGLSEADGDEQIITALSYIVIAIESKYCDSNCYSLRKETVQKVARDKKESLGAGGWSQEVARAYQKVMIAFREFKE